VYCSKKNYQLNTFNDTGPYQCSTVFQSMA